MTRETYVAHHEMSKLGVAQHMVDNHRYEIDPSSASDEDISVAAVEHSQIDHRRDADHDHRP